MFAFEIQCNAFVPVFFLLYVVQYLLLPLLLQVPLPPISNKTLNPYISSRLTFSQSISMVILLSFDRVLTAGYPSLAACQHPVCCRSVLV